MSTWLPQVSVVIPAYNQALFLGEAIGSLLDQSYTDYELIVVNDASPDNTDEVVSQFTDARIKYIVHKHNKGLPAARNTGIRNSRGEFIALLDADDIFHPTKLESHINFFEEHPHIGVSYNNRFELNYSAKTIRGIWRPPRTVSLVDFVRGFPFCPSDMVLRRDWAYKVNLFREEFNCGGEDLDFFCRLAISGCKFARVDRALIYRRYHSGRLRKKLPCRLDDYTRALDTVFEDPRCPEDVMIIRNEAFASHYLEVAYYALLQGEIDFGQETIRRVIRLDPTLLDGNPSRLVDYFLNNIIKDENRDHEKLLWQMISHLPFEIAKLSEQTNWAVGRGYILRGTRAIIWNRIEVGEDH
ncbi:MAG: glycosyltransferase family 2 protein, partial [Desulfobacteraceae bacterium]|nr:glycosyltransferase family 2 protein [Desulfobacteraceae bacterium]